MSDEEKEMMRTQKAVRELEAALVEAKRLADEAWRKYVRSPKP